MARIKVNVKGPIIGDSMAWIYNLLGMACTSAAGFKRELAKAQDGDTVVIEINSPGGYVNEAAEIYEAIRTFSGEVECKVVGQAASCASFIACAAKSSISPMGYLFLHNCSTSCSGNQHDMRQTMESLASIDENIMGAYKAKTGMSDEELYKLMEQNTTISAQRAVELGFIDRITDEGNNVTAFGAGSNTEGIAAAAPGLIDFDAIDLEKVAQLRDAYMKTQDSAGGGTEMEIKDMVDELDEASATGCAASDVEEAEGEEEASEEQPDNSAEDADEETEASDGDAADDDGEREDAESEDSGVEDRYEEGVLAERSRIEGIMAISGNIDADMVHDALFVNPVNAQQLAFNALSAKAGKVSNYMSLARADFEASSSSAVASNIVDGNVAGKTETDSLTAKMAERINN